MPLSITLLLEAVMRYVILQNVRKSKPNIIEALAVISIFTITSFLVINIIPAFEISGIIANIFAVLIMAAITNISIKLFPLSMVYALFATIILLWSVTLTNVVADFITLIIPGVNMQYRDDIISNWMFTILYLSIVLIIGFFASHKIGTHFQKKIRLYDIKLQRQLAIYLLFSALVVLGLFFINVFISELLEDTAARTLVYASSSTIWFIFLVLAVFVFIDKLKKETEIKHKDELLHDLNAYTRHVEEMATEMRSFRHDHKNLMLMFHTHIESRNWDELSNRYKDYLKEFSIGDDAIEICMDKLSNIQTPELKAFLYIKFMQAHRLGIDTVIEVDDNIVIKGGYNLLDTCRIMGIFMDNAIDACKDVEGAIIRFMCNNSGDSAFFVLQNTCLIPPPANKMGAKGFTTKEAKEGGRPRGMGLYNVQSMVRKNPYISLQTTIRDGNFTQELKVAPEED